MGMPLGSTGSSVRTYTVMNRNGTVAGTLSVSTSNKKKSKETKQRLNYNFKSVSSMILRAKTSGSASQAVIKARGKLANLRRKLHTDKYDDKELENAITHAAKMVRIAKKRVNHLKEEEESDKKGVDIPNEEETEEESEVENMLADPEMGGEEMEQKIKECMTELQNQMRELLKEIDREGWMEELSGEIIADTSDMSPQERENLRKRHRAAEMRDIIKADMEYLKAKFQQLAREKEEAQNANTGFGGDSTQTLTGVTLELGGVGMPVSPPDIPVPSEGANVDASL